jgi:hypothetical protein
MSKVAVVAVQSNLIGRRVRRPTTADVGGNVDPENPYKHVEHLWPKTFEPNATGQYLADVVAVFVGDLQEGGVLKFMLADVVSGRTAVAYQHSIILAM